MCGRFVIDAVLSRRVSARLGIAFAAPANADVCPTQTVATLADPGNGLGQLDMLWGIRPEWAKRPLINARVETAAENVITSYSIHYTKLYDVMVDGWALHQIERDMTIRIAAVTQQP